MPLGMGDNTVCQSVPYGAGKMGKQFRIPKVCRFPCHLAWLSVLRGPRQSSSVGSWGYFVCILSSAFFPGITAVNFLMTACLIICFKGVSPDRSGKKQEKINPGLTLTLLQVQVLRFRGRLFTKQVLITSCWSAVQISFTVTGWDQRQQAWPVDLPPLWCHQYCCTVNVRDKSCRALTIALSSSELNIFLHAFNSAALQVLDSILPIIWVSLY